LAKLLIIDDDALVLDAFSEVVRKMGHTPHGASSVTEALNLLQSQQFDVVFCDVRMPDGSGLDILPEIRGAHPPPEVIIITGYGDPEGAELAIKQGAWDYLEKPVSVKEIMLCVERTLQYREKKQEAKIPIALKREEIIGNGPKLKVCLDSLAQAAQSEASVLITGETGTGKELFAWAVHNNSARAGRNFVVLDCAALPETLVESTLFGHVRGAFTGADKARDGLVKQADGGTLFLDEIGELSIGIQKAFLRVLQEKRCRPVGGGQEVHSDFRLVAATNRDLESMVKKGTFRDDLLFRIRTLVIELPPLREDKEELKSLVLHYLAKLCGQYNIQMKGFSPEFYDLLITYDWPGNIRELIQALERAVIAAKDDPILFPKHLPEHIRIRVARASVVQRMPRPQSAGETPDFSAGPLSLNDAREAGVTRIEKEYLIDLMRRFRGDISEACRISGLSRSRLYTLLKKHGVSPSNGRL
jgi:two-component system, NtrC family, response regulator